MTFCRKLVLFQVVGDKDMTRYVLFIRKLNWFDGRTGEISKYFQVQYGGPNQIILKPGALTEWT